MSELVSRLADPAYVRFQYANDEKLRIRIETHERYSENPVPFTTWVLSHVDARPGQTLLDVGSGPGQYHDKLRGLRVIALDTSAGMLAKVKVPAVLADAQRLPFGAQSFDRVMANHVIYHLPDMTLAMRELRRVARPGGRVVMAANSRASMRPLFALTDEAAAEAGIAGYPRRRSAFRARGSSARARDLPERARRVLRRRLPFRLSGAGACLRGKHVGGSARPREAHGIPCGRRATSALDSRT